MDLISGISVALIAGSISSHVTTEHEPLNGYNQNHKSIGFEVVQDKEGITNGVQAFKFKDSFNKNSFSTLYSLGYTKRFKSLSVRSGGAIGYVDTSYYNGVVAMPFVGVMYKRVGADLGFIPKVKGGDAVLSLQFKFKLN